MSFRIRISDSAKIIGLLFSLCVLTIASPAMGKQSTSRGPVFWVDSVLTPTFPVEGAISKVTRTDSGISVLVRTLGLTPGDAYTLWLIVFNFPEECREELCSGADLENELVAGDTMFLAGNVVGRSGRAAFAGHKGIGDNSGSILPPLLPDGIQPPGLLNPMGAQFLLLVHSHGPKIPEHMPDMIHTFSGGCVDPGFPFQGTHFPEWGEQGPNTCESQQGAFHAPQAP